MDDTEAPARRRIPVARKIVYSCLLAVLCLAAALFLAELGLRIFAPRENIPQRQYDPYLGWKGVPNLDCILNERLFKIEIRHNSQGFRDRERTIVKPPGCFRILAVGDSFTWGWGVRQEQIYTNRAGAPAFGGRAERRGDQRGRRGLQHGSSAPVPHAVRVPVLAGHGRLSGMFQRHPRQRQEPGRGHLSQAPLRADRRWAHGTEGLPGA